MDLYAPLAPIIGLMMLMGVVMILMCATLLWTLLMFGGIVATWHRQWCITDDTGVETGGYIPTLYRDGSLRRKSISEAHDELDAEAESELTEPEDRETWSQVKHAEDDLRKARTMFWQNYDR